MITFKITRSSMSNNVAVELRSLLLRPFHIAYNTWNSIDSGNVFSLFLDFRKAVNCFIRDILSSKLNNCGTSGITVEWFRSFLINREQYVYV